jgi:GT2 family glycosyltransferase
VSTTLAIVVQFNAATITTRCLLHLQNQTEPCDVLIVDNGSTDDSADRLSARLRSCDRLILPRPAWGSLRRLIWA